MHTLIERQLYLISRMIMGRRRLLQASLMEDCMSLVTNSGHLVLGIHCEWQNVLSLVTVLSGIHNLTFKTLRTSALFIAMTCGQNIWKFENRVEKPKAMFSLDSGLLTKCNRLYRSCDIQTTGTNLFSTKIHF